MGVQQLADRTDGAAAGVAYDRGGAVVVGVGLEGNVLADVVLEGVLGASWGQPDISISWEGPG